MDFQVGAGIVQTTVQALARGDDIQAVWREATEAATTAVPDRAWQAIAALDPSADAALAREWLRRGLMTNPLPASASGIWFGLYEYDGGEATGADGTTRGVGEAAIRVTGSVSYPDPEWLFDEAWAATGLLPAPGLRSLNHLAAKGHDDVYALTSYALVFTYAASMALDVISGGTFGARKLAVACGFHDGDVALVAKVDGQDVARTEPGWV